MASGQTTSYGLNQWLPKDPVLREEFNADHRKINDALQVLSENLLRIVSGSYIGTGAFGEGNPNTLEFPFVPQMVVIQEMSLSSSNSGAILLRGQEICTGIVTSHGLALNLTWNDTVLSWYTTQSYPQYQLNSEGQTYYYWAIG